MAISPASSGLDNDTRGWIMCVVSGIACVVGASIVCVDVIVRLFPGKKNFRIQDSNVFLACSLSLSFGVMLFSALYSMLPESKEYFEQAKWSKQAAGLTMMACFVGGFIGIQGVSRLLHQFMPTHVVECDHSHDENATKDTSCQHDRRQSRARHSSSLPPSSQAPIDKSLPKLVTSQSPNTATESRLCSIRVWIARPVLLNVKPPPATNCDVLLARSEAALLPMPSPRGESQFERFTSVSCPLFKIQSAIATSQTLVTGSRIHAARSVSSI
ncbi:hypothetical protein NXS19_011631 [Fusarium pseudograminearum]|nr:hypothetical protein NXS19_011631 [Fusarium pseudograminearum]